MNHDDLALADFLIHNDPPIAAPTLTTLTASHTPLPYAIDILPKILWDYLSLNLAAHKTHLFQPSLAANHPSALLSLTHLLPAGSSISTSHLVLAGLAYGTTAGILASLAADVTCYIALLQRLLTLPALPTQLRLLILTISCRPSSTFGHALSYHPPSLTTQSTLPSPHYHHPSFANALRHHLLTALA